MAVVIETTLGDITVDLYLDQRPVTCLNFLKLCKMKYYNFNLFHTIRSGFIAQTGDPSGEGSGGQSVFGVLEGESKRFFSGEKMPKIRHTDTGLLSMVCTEDTMVGSQFFLTLGPDLDSLDGIHCVIGEVTEGLEVLRKLNDVICDESHRPYQDVRITHTVVLEDPFNDPPGLRAPSRSPSPSAERLKGGRIAPDEELDETQGKSAAEVQEMIEEKEAKARATILEIVGDLPDADIAPPENVLFVCKLNPVTTDEDLEIIFSRFGKIVSCEVIRDKKTGDSLQYAFIEFDDKKSCESAYFKMDNVLIDDRRIHVDFSQSVSKMRWLGKGRGVKYFNDGDLNDNKSGNHKSKRSNSQEKDGKHKEYRNERTNRTDRDNKYEHEHRHNREHRNDRDRTSDREHRKDRDHRTNKEYRNDREHKNDKEHNRDRDRYDKQKKDDSRKDREQRNGQENKDNRNSQTERNKTSRNHNDKEVSRGSERYNARDRDSESNKKAKDRSRSRSRLDNYIEKSSKANKDKPYDYSENHKMRNSKTQNKDSTDRHSSSNKDEKHSQYSKSRYNESPTRKPTSDNDRSLSKRKRTDSNQRVHANHNNNDEQKQHRTHKDNALKKHKHNDDRGSNEMKNKSSLEPHTPSPTAIDDKQKSVMKRRLKKEKASKRKLNSKKKRKQSTSCSGSDSSDSSSSSSDSTSSSDSGAKKRRTKRRKRHSSSTSSSSSSSSSTTSSSSSDSSSTSSSSESDSKKKPKSKKKDDVNKSKKKS